MKLFTCKQIAEIDRLSMKYEPISSIDLMERASKAVCDWIIRDFSNRQELILFAGPGNNGGDVLAIARLLAEYHYSCTVYLATFGRELKGDAATNWQRLHDQNKVTCFLIDSEESIPEISGDILVVDGLFGSGLNKPLSGLAKEIVNLINHSGATVISVDIPSGLFGEDNSLNDFSAIIKANYTLSFQFPKVSFFFQENARFIGHCKILPIGLHPEAILETESNYYSLNATFASGMVKKREKFSHKGTYGHALLIAGSYGKMGAAILGSKACLRAGAGLLTTHVPASGYPIIQSTIPEAMCSVDPSEVCFSSVPEINAYTAIGIGPGLGKHAETNSALRNLLLQKPKKMIIDADALNLMAENRELISFLPENAILTPHPKEFERLVGTSVNSFDRLCKQSEFSTEHQVIVVLKGAHTCITLPDGSAFFNTSGNPGMATAGSGDVLSGVILGLLAQDYTNEEAALLGVYLHGLAGDLAAELFGQHAMIAGDIINLLGAAFLRLE